MDRNDDDTKELSTYEHRLDNPDGGAPNATEASARLERVAEGPAVTEVTPEPKRTYSGAKRGPKPGNKRGPKPGSKRGPKPRHRVPEPESAAKVSGFKTRAAYESEIDALEAQISELRARSSAPSPEELAEMRDTLEGIVIFGQMALVQVVGHAAVLNDEQVDKLVRVWQRPYRKLMAWITTSLDVPGTEVPSWVIGVMYAIIALATSVAIVWPNWKMHRDGLPVDASGAIVRDVAALDDRRPVEDFMRPRGVE